MLLDDKYNQLERLLKEYPINSDEYKRISLLMFGYTDDEIDEMIYKPVWSRHEVNFPYDDAFAEVVERDDYLWDYPDICKGSIMKDKYCERPKIMTDSYINLNNKGGVDVK